MEATEAQQLKRTWRGLSPQREKGMKLVTWLWPMTARAW